MIQANSYTQTPSITLPNGDLTSRITYRNTTYNACVLDLPVQIRLNRLTRVSDIGIALESIGNRSGNMFIVTTVTQKINAPEY